MNWEEFIKQTEERKIAKKQEILSEYTERKQELLQKGISESDADSMAKRKLMSYYKKMLRSSLEKMQFIIYSVDRATDYGMGKKYKEAKELYSKNPGEAIQSGLTDIQGNPLYIGDKTTDKRVGKPINLDTVSSRRLFALGRKQDDGKYTEWKETEIMAQYDFCKPDSVLPMYCIVEANVFIKTTSNEELLRVSTRVGETKFEIVDKTIVEFPDLVKKHLTDRMLSVKKLEKWAEHFKEKRDAYFILSGLDVIDSFGARLILNHEDFALFNGITELACWYPDFLPRNFSDTALNLTIVGRAYINQDGNVTVNLFGVWIPKIDRIEITAEEITPEKTKVVTQHKEQVVDTQKVLKPEEAEEANEKWYE